MIIPCKAMTVLWIWLLCCCFEATSSFVHTGDVSMKNLNSKLFMVLLDRRRKQACCCCCCCFPRQAVQVLAPSSNTIRSKRIITAYLSCQENDNDYEDRTTSADDDEFVDVYDSSPVVGEKDFDLFLPLAGFAVLFVAFWPLLAVIGNPEDPTSGFDIDIFMSLKSIIDSSSSSNAQQAGDIVELPSLSPGERIVDVFFGLPTSRSFGDF